MTKCVHSIVRSSLWCSLAAALVSAAACKKVERLGFDPEAPIVIDSDKGVTVPKVVGKTASGETVELDEAVAIAVTPAGLIEVQGQKLLPTKNGKATLVASSGELTGTLEVIVRIIDEVRLTCPQTPCALGVGESLQLNGQVLALGAAFEAELAWSSSADSVAKVDKGMVTGVGAGSATITMETVGRKATLDVTVRPQLAELRLFCANPPLFVTAQVGTAGAVRDRSCEAAAKEPLRLFAEAIAAGKPNPDERFEWSSSDGSLMVVKGETIPDRAGGAVVTVKVGATSAEVPVSVLEKKRGAPICDDAGAKWNANVEIELKATLAEQPFEPKVALRCQGKAGTDCAEAAYGELRRSIGTFGVDAESGKRMYDFFTEETKRRCCCATQ